MTLKRHCLLIGVVHKERKTKEKPAKENGENQKGKCAHGANEVCPGQCKLHHAWFPHANKVSILLLIIS